MEQNWFSLVSNNINLYNDQRYDIDKSLKEDI